MSRRSLLDTPRNTGSLMPGMRSSYGGRRFSLDAGDDLFLSSNPQALDLHSSAAPVASNLLSSYPAVLPSRRRAMTSTALSGASGLELEDSLFGDFNADEPFESSQGSSYSLPSPTDPLFIHAPHASSLSLEPDSYTAAHPLGSVDFSHPLRSFHYLPLSRHAYDQPHVPPVGSLDFPGEGFDEGLGIPPFRPGRSFSDVDMPSMQDSYETTKNPHGANTSLVEAIRPRLLKHNSIGSIHSSYDDLYPIPDAPPSPKQYAQVVKGSINFPANSTFHNSATPPEPSPTVSPVSTTPQTSNESHHKAQGNKKSGGNKMGGCSRWT